MAMASSADRSLRTPWGMNVTCWRGRRGVGVSLFLVILVRLQGFFVSLQRCLDIIYTSFIHIYTLHVFLHVLYCPFSCPWIGWDDYTDELTNVVFGL